MKDEDRGDEQTPETTSNPGHTAGSAEGDRETVEADLDAKGIAGGVDADDVKGETTGEERDDEAK